MVGGRRSASSRRPAKSSDGGLSVVPFAFLFGVVLLLPSSSGRVTRAAKGKARSSISDCLGFVVTGFGNIVSPVVSLGEFGIPGLSCHQVSERSRNFRPAHNRARWIALSRLARCSPVALFVRFRDRCNPSRAVSAWF